MLKSQINKKKRTIRKYIISLIKKKQNIPSVNLYKVIEMDINLTKKKQVFSMKRP